MGRTPRIAQARKRGAALENVHEVEAIRCIRLHKGKIQYLIKWKGWAESYNTWEPHENLVNCNAVLREFERRQDLQGYLRTSSQALVPFHKESHENSGGSRGVKKHCLGFKRAVRMALATKQQLEATGTDGNESASVSHSHSDEEAETETEDTKPPTVERVIKAVKYTTKIVDGRRDLTVLFKVLRSDGTKDVVDNKYLRATCPYLLLDFYEDRVKHA